MRQPQSKMPTVLHSEILGAPWTLTLQQDCSLVMKPARASVGRRLIQELREEKESKIIWHFYLVFWEGLPLHSGPKRWSIRQVCFLRFALLGLQELPQWFLHSFLPLPGPQQKATPLNSIPYLAPTLCFKNQTSSNQSLAFTMGLINSLDACSSGLHKTLPYVIRPLPVPLTIKSNSRAILPPHLAIECIA